MADETVWQRAKRIRNSQLSMPQTFYLITLNEFIGKNPDAWPSQATIAWAMNATPRSVRNWQVELEQIGVIQVDVGKGRSSTNRYRLNLDSLRLKEEPRSALNEEPHSSFTGDSEQKRGTTFLPNEEPRSYEMRNDVPTERTMKEQKKEQAFLFPENLDTEEFKTAWSEWVTFRREIKKKLTPSTIQRQLTRLATWGSDKAIRSIELSIENGWQGLFDPDQRNGKASATTRLPGSDDWLSVLAAIDKFPTRSQEDIAGRKTLLGPDRFEAMKRIGSGRIFEANDFERNQTLKPMFLSHLQEVRSASKAGN